MRFHSLSVLALVVVLAGCPAADTDTDTASDAPVDNDSDGAMSDVDCDDDDPTRFPGAPETCNGVDDDCDGFEDNGLSAPLAAKQDGVCEDAVKVCDGASGFVEPDYTDINGYEATESSCDGDDNDCNDTVDDVDADTDGHAPLACGGDDCDDDRPTVYAGASEDGGDGSRAGDGLDNDCDNLTDEDLFYGSGVDGPLVVSGETDLSAHGLVCARAAEITGSRSLRVTSADLTGTASDHYAAGDKVLLHQAQGFLGGGSDENYTYQWTTVAAVASDTITFTSDFSSDWSGTVPITDDRVLQVLRVPQFTTVSVDAGASLVAPSWDGACGGTLAFTASESAEVLGDVSMAEAGFSGAPMNEVANKTGYRGEGEKGLVLVHSWNASGAGGGGGGGPIPSCTPACDAPGGGGGGFTAGELGDDGPHNGGSGKGGRAVQLADGSRVVFGGGGGSGSNYNGDPGGGGGRGGGNVLIQASSLHLAGAIASNGEDGHDANHLGDASGGGGGGGGMIWVRADAMTAVTGATLNALGGSGVLSNAFTFSGTGGDGLTRLDFLTLNGVPRDTADTSVIQLLGTEIVTDEP